MFFLEPSLALLEFGIALKKWKMKTNFHYYTIEHDESEGPILAFIKKQESHWCLFSIWQLFEAKEMLTLNMIIGAVDSFLYELDQELIKKIFGIKLDDFIKK